MIQIEGQNLIGSTLEVKSNHHLVKLQEFYPALYKELVSRDATKFVVVSLGVDGNNVVNCITSVRIGSDLIATSIHFNEIFLFKLVSEHSGPDLSRARRIYEHYYNENSSMCFDLVRVKELPGLFDKLEHDKVDIEERIVQLQEKLKILKSL